MITLTKPIQREFDYKLSANRPLLPVKAAMALLNQTEKQIANLIELGLLLWAFDISRANAEHRREVRILQVSLVDYHRGVLPQEGWRDLRKEPASKSEWNDVVKLILPNYDLRCSELARRFFCSSTHILQLLEDGSLQPVPMPGRKAKESPKVMRASVVEFLRRRIV
ncbi:MAG: hypothetical protein JWM16_570, partial [Verrucomicrobiales bacterium]|nr:hypothetical protein [Verrucomicrobiales bacterium]